jgi:hypothetical protein
MKAARMFALGVADDGLMPQVHTVRVALYGSLGLSLGVVATSATDCQWYFLAKRPANLASPGGISANIWTSLPRTDVLRTVK